jgi:hypothetical protein
MDSHAFRGPRGYFTGQAHAIAGRMAQAGAEWRAALTVVNVRLKTTPDDRELLLFAAWLNSALGDNGIAETFFARSQGLAGLKGDSMDDINYSALAQLRKKEALLAGAEQVFTKKDSFRFTLHAEMRFSPRFDFMRNDPRFNQMLRDHPSPGANPFNESAPPGKQ